MSEPGFVEVLQRLGVNILPLEGEQQIGMTPRPMLTPEEMSEMQERRAQEIARSAAFERSFREQQNRRRKGRGY